MRLRLVERELAPEAARVVRVGAAEADEDGRVVRRAQHDAALVEVAVLHAGLVQREQGGDDLFPARRAKRRGDGTGVGTRSWRE